LTELLKEKNQQLVSVIYLDVPDEELVGRGTGRRIHPASGRSYHIVSKPPKVPDKDDITGEPLIQRDDDKEDVIKKRLETFHTNNGPIINFYEGSKIVHKVNGKGKIDDIWQEVDKALSTHFEPSHAAEAQNRCILIIGAPASGKGTQAEKIKASYSFLY
jgi:adenylate kinase